MPTEARVIEARAFLALFQVDRAWVRLREALAEDAEAVGALASAEVFVLRGWPGRAQEPLAAPGGSCRSIRTSRVFGMRSPDRCQSLQRMRGKSSGRATHRRCFRSSSTLHGSAAGAVAVEGFAVVAPRMIPGGRTALGYPWGISR